MSFRLVVHERLGSHVEESARQELWAALDELEMASPAFFAEMARQDAADVEELRRRHGLPPRPEDE